MEILLKPLSKIIFEDIQFLVNSKIKENNYLEYKGCAFLNKSKNEKKWDEHRGELIKKIAGLANNRGGIIIHGIETDNNSKEPTEICSPDDFDFQNVLSRCVMNGLQPVINIEWMKISNPINPNLFVRVMKIPESSSPVMVYMKNQIEGIFPIRTGEDTKIADLYDVENLFRIKGENLRLQHNAIEIFDRLFDLSNISDKKLHTNTKINMLRRMSIQFKDQLPELGIIVIEKSDNISLVILDNYQLFYELIINLEDPRDKDSVGLKMLKNLRDYWERKNIIRLRSSDFSNKFLLEVIEFED